MKKNNDIMNLTTFFNHNEVNYHRVYKENGFCEINIDKLILSVVH